MGYGARPNPKKRKIEARVFQEANIDTAGLDPEMKATLAGEAARRVGAAGVQLRTADPLRGIKDLFRRKGKK